MKGFCEECRDYVEYIITVEKRTKDIKGKSIEYESKIAHCNECSSELFISELRDQNLHSLDKAYRETENLIKVSEIVKILEKYNIGKRPLSVLLGWGETTLTRYVDGDIPTKQYSKVLKKISNEPSYLLEVLESNKDKVTETAYKKCFEAVQLEKALVFNCVVNSKIESVANYIISKSIEITPLALQKLVYFSQSFYKAFRGDFLFEDDCEAWVHGPVYKEIYYKYKDHGYNPIEESKEQFDCFDLSETEIEIIDAVINNFGCYSGKILEKMTHVELPWRETRIGLSDAEPSDRKIKKSLITSYFNQVKEKYKMINITDMKDYGDDIFKKVRH